MGEGVGKGRRPGSSGQRTQMSPWANDASSLQLRDGRERPAACSVAQATEEVR